jgi:alpha-galactosidase/6-phospho-beta-glucosidase family protein
MIYEVFLVKGKCFYKEKRVASGKKQPAHYMEVRKLLAWQYHGINHMNYTIACLKVGSYYG